MSNNILIIFSNKHKKIWIIISQLIFFFLNKFLYTLIFGETDRREKRLGIE